MPTGGFQRTNPLGDGFIRGPARILVEPYATVWPTTIGKIINLATTGYKTEKQEIEKQAPVGNVGTFKVAFASYPTKELAFGATGAQIQVALEELPSIGSGGITCTNPTKKLTEEALKFEFAGELAQHAQPLMAIVNNNVKETAIPSVFGVKRTEAGFGLYDPVGSWTELGSTKGGIKIMRNNTESVIDIDQIQAAITALPDEWEMTIDTALAETTLEGVQVAWEGGEIINDATQSPNERHLGMGNPLSYEERRLAILYKKTVGTSAGKIRAHVFRRVTHAPQTSTIDFQKTGNMTTLPVMFRCFADATVADPKFSMGEIIDQQYS